MEAGGWEGGTQEDGRAKRVEKLGCWDVGCNGGSFRETFTFQENINEKIRQDCISTYKI